MNRLKRYWYDNEFHYFYDGYVYVDPNFFIEYTANENPNLLYFKVYREGLSTNCTRISMLKPEYMDPFSFKLTKSELDKLKKELTQERWNDILWSINDALIGEGIIDKEIYLPMIDYSTLETED